MNQQVLGEGSAEWTAEFVAKAVADEGIIMHAVLEKRT